MKDQKKTNRLETKKMTDLMELLKAQGILADEEITDEEQRRLQQERRKRLYHNTRVLLENYRDIAWALECFPDTVAEELDVPFQPLDALLDRMDAEGCMGNRKLESRVESVRKSRLLLDRVNEALTILRKKPGNGARLYELIYLSYIAPEKLSHTDLLFRLDLSSRQYYRLRDQAIDVIAVRLWAVPVGEMDLLLGVVGERVL